MNAGQQNATEGVEVPVSSETSSDSPFEAYYRGWQMRGRNLPCVPPPLLPPELQAWYSVGWSMRDANERSEGR